MRTKIFFIIFFLICISPESVLSNSSPQRITLTNKTVFLGKSYLNGEDNWDIRWSDDYGIADSTVLYVEERWDNTENSFSGKVLSIVGPYISFQVVSSGYSEGAAHPWHVQYYETKNISNGKKVKLTDLFEEEEVFKALLNDSVIKKALGDNNPKDLNELFKQVDGKCDFYLDEDSLNSFAFHHIKGEMVAIRLGLKHGCEASRGNFTQLGFYLKIPESLKRSLDRANKNNVLMDKMIKLNY